MIGQSNSRQASSAPLVAPPEGVVAGESVPRENTAAERCETAVERLANAMKAMPGYASLSDAERRQKAREKLRAKGVL